MRKRSLDKLIAGIKDDAARAETIRARLTSDASVARAKLTSESFNAARTARGLALAVAAVFCVGVGACATTIVADRWHDVELARIKANH